MLLTIADETRINVFKPWAFCVVSRMVLQRTTAELEGIAIISSCLRGTCTVQTTVTVESEKGFGKHILGSSQPTRRHMSSLKGRQKPCGWKV